MCSESVVTTRRLISGHNAANLIECAISGKPASDLTFFPGRPFDPPRAGTTASILRPSSIFRILDDFFSSALCRTAGGIADREASRSVDARRQPRVGFLRTGQERRI